MYWNSTKKEMCEKYYQNYMMIIAIAIFVIIRFIIISINVFSTEHPGKVSRVSFFWRGSISLHIRKISFPSFQLNFFTC